MIHVRIQLEPRRLNIHELDEIDVPLILQTIHDRKFVDSAERSSHGPL